MTSQPLGLQESIRFSEEFEFELRPRRLRRGRHTLKLERIPLEILLLLLERSGELVSREEIVARIWGEDIFLDTDNSIRGAVRKIRHALKDNPKAPRFIQTVTGRGYRFIAPVEKFSAIPAKPIASTVEANVTISLPDAKTESQSEGLHQVEDRRVFVTRSLPGEPLLLPSSEEELKMQPMPSAEGYRHPEYGRSRKWLSVAIASLLVLILLAAIGFSRWRIASGPSGVPQRKMVLAVLPFDNLSQDADQEFFSDGLTEEMIAQIGKLSRDRLAIVARGSSARYKGSKMTAKEIGRELNADYLVQGSVRRSSDRVRITVQLIDAKNQTDLWTESYDRELKDVLVVQNSVVGNIASEIHLALSEQQRWRLKRYRQTSPDAYLAYLKGRFYWNRRTDDGIERAERYFQEAIDRDPTFAAAYSGLADCNSGLAWHGFKSPADALPKAYSAARKAIEIDPESAEAHASLGLVLSHRWEWAEAEVEFRRALELDPQYANAHHWYGDYLSIRGRHEEAISEAHRAVELDPLNLMVSSWMGLRYYLARDYSAAIKQNRDSVELDPNFAAAHLLLGEDYLGKGMYDEAISELRKAASLARENSLYIAQIAVALASAGRDREALRIVQRLEADSKRRYVSPYGLARIYAALHRDSDALKWLQAAREDHAVWMGYLAVDPVFDRYRSDTLFQELLKETGLI